jgi:plasmid replication initiation protein
MSKKIIVKQNDLIDNFIFNATELELQILNYAVAITNPHWENKNLVYRIDIPELVVTFKTKANNMHEQYKKALNRLMKREISFYVGKKKHTQNIVVEYIEDMEDTSYLVFKFNEHVSTRISKLKGLFTQYDIKHIANFKSRYAFLLYEYFKMKLQQQTQEKTEYKKEFLIAEFKEKLDISSKYKVFAMLETYVLKTAKTNINKHSDINIEYRVKRKGQTPISIVFKARYKNKSDKTKNLQPENLKLEKEVENPISYDTNKPTEEEATRTKGNLNRLKKGLSIKH